MHGNSTAKRSLTNCTFLLVEIEAPNLNLCFLPPRIRHFRVHFRLFIKASPSRKNGLLPMTSYEVGVRIVWIGHRPIWVFSDTSTHTFAVYLFAEGECNDLLQIKSHFSSNCDSDCLTDDVRSFKL